MAYNSNLNDISYYCDFLFNNVEISTFLDPTFFLDISPVLRTSKEPPPTHSHSHYELIAVVKGSLFAQSGGDSLTIEQGQCLFCPAKVVHTTIGETDDTTILSINFSMKKTKVKHKFQDAYACFSDIFNQKNIVAIPGSAIYDNFIKIQTSLKKQDRFMHIQIQILLQEIILELCKVLQNQSEYTVHAVPVSFGNNFPYLINLKINTHLKDLTLKSIADEFFISKRQLERHILNSFGMTFTERRNYLRLETAKNLLSDTDLSIDDIMDEIGFSNKSDFYKKFSALTGTTPGKYRKQQKELKSNNKT